MTEYKMTLSTTEPNNYVGLIKLRQGDAASQSIQATITANGQLFKFDHLAVFFNAVLPNGNVIRDKMTNVDYVNSKLNYIVADSFLQEVAQVTAWFSFENNEKIIDSTKNFQYSVIAGWKECISQGNYIYELSEIQHEIEEIIGNKDFTSLISKISSLETDVKYLDNSKTSKEELAQSNKVISDTIEQKYNALESSKASKDYLNIKISQQNEKISNIVSGTPKGTYENLSSLKLAYPSGASGVFLAKDNGHWYYWNNVSWTDGGIYRATVIGNGSIGYKELKPSGKIGKFSSENFTIDFKTSKIIVVNDLYVLDGVSRYLISKGSTYDLTRTTGYLAFNYESKEIKVYAIDETYTLNLDFNLILGIIWSGEKVETNNIFPTKVVHATGSIEMLYNDVTSDRSLVKMTDYAYILSDNCDIVIDSTTKTMSSSGTIVIVYKNIIRYLTTFDISGYTSNTPGMFYFDPDENKVKACPATGFSQISKVVAVLGYYWAGMNSVTLNTNANVIVNGNVQQQSQRVALSRKKLVFLGDSITEGLKSYATSTEAGTFYDKPFPWWLSYYFGGTFNNLGKSGGSFVGSTSLDFTSQYNSVNFSDYDIAVIALGVNDYNKANSMESVKTELRKGITKMLSDNPALKIMGSLPQNSCRNKWTTPPNTVYVNSFDFPNSNGHTLKDFCQAISEVYEELYIPYYDWRKTPILTKGNQASFSWDGIHLNGEGHKIQGRRLAEFMKLYI